MSRRHRTDIPSWTLTAGEKIQQTAKNMPLDWLINLTAGSSSPNYLQVEWSRVDRVAMANTNKDAEFPVAEGDPNASILSIASRFKKTAAIFLANMYEVDEVVEELGGHPVVGYTYRDQTRVGLLPRGVFDLRETRGSYYQAAMRMGRGDVPAGIGVWLPDESVVLRPRDSIVAEQNVPIKALPYRYPGITLV